MKNCSASAMGTSLSFSPWRISVGVCAAATYLSAERCHARSIRVPWCRNWPNSISSYLVVVGHVVVADQIDDARGRYRGFELIRLRDQPLGQLAAVADAFNAQ